MSSTRDRGYVIFECNKCGDTLNTECKRWDDALTVLDDNGWITIPSEMKGVREFEHICDQCSGDELEIYDSKQ